MNARLGATLTTLYLQFEKEAEAALGLPPGLHSYRLPHGPVRAGSPCGSGRCREIDGASLTKIRVPWRSDANRSPERNPFNVKGRTGLCLAALSWLGPFPAIPQWKCPIVPRPSKIMLSNATSPTGIEKGSSPVRGLWSEPRPLVVTSKLSLPIIWCDRRSPIFHLASPEPSVRAPSGSFSAKTILSGDGSLLATWDISINEWWTTSRRKSGSVKLPTVIL